MDIYKLTRPITLSGVILLAFTTFPHIAHGEQHPPFKNQSKASVAQLSEQQKADSAKIEQLENIILKQKNNLDDLKEEIQNITDKSDTNVTTFNVWSGILLGASALILTALGIVIAIFSFVGWRDIKSKSAEIAKEVALTEARLKLDQLIESGEFDTVIREVVGKLADHGEFDAVVREIIDKLTYRGIQPTETQEEAGDQNDNIS